MLPLCAIEDVVTGEVDALAAPLAKVDRERLSDVLARLLDQVPDR
ncbi:hypothetical protein WMF04_32575 [Sorangium sp. So ce260]